VDFRAFVAVL